MPNKHLVALLWAVGSSGQRPWSMSACSLCCCLGRVVELPEAQASHLENGHEDLPTGCGGGLT